MPRSVTAPERNRLEVLSSAVSGGRVVFRYDVSGEWADCFRPDKTFFVEYPFDAERMPEGVRIVPFLSQVLPVAWICDAEVRVPVCDRDFLGCLEAVEGGYRAMHPRIPFGGKLVADRLERGAPAEKPSGRPVACFSGGVDAHATVLRHLPEKPLLCTIWGSDVPWDDEEGWRPVEALARGNAEKLGLEILPIRSSFRDLLDLRRLDRRVEASGDIWWHGFQHGLGILGHLAPVAWKTGAGTVYIASSFTAADSYACASDPSIDDHVRFCGAAVVHDGYECDRQDKVRLIAEWSSRTGMKLPLHVCWKKKGGDNCCHCEKCWRTMLALWAEGADPRDFGFAEFDGVGGLPVDMERDAKGFRTRMASRYGPIRKRIADRMPAGDVPPELAWLVRGGGGAAAARARLGEARARNAGAKTETRTETVARLRETAAKTLGPLVDRDFRYLVMPDHANAGDFFIYLGERAFLAATGHRCLEETTMRSFSARNPEIGGEDLLVLRGGGSFGDIWSDWTFYANVLASRKDNPVLILPQSVHFTRNENLEEMRRAVAAHGRTTLCVRDRASFRFASENFDCRVVLAPDSAFLWDPGGDRRPEEGDLLVERHDREASWFSGLSEESECAAATVADWPSIDFPDCEWRILCRLQKRVPDEPGEYDRFVRNVWCPHVVNRAVRLFRPFKTVWSTRLHGAILAILMGKETVVIDNRFGKSKAFYDTWLSGCEGVDLLEPQGER